MPTTDQLTAAVDIYVAAFAAGDPVAVTNLFASDGTVEDPVGTPLKQGRAEILAFYTMSMSTGATLELLGEPRCAGDYVAFPFSVNLEFGGARQRIEVIDTFRFNGEGAIAEMRAYWGPANIKPE